MPALPALPVYARATPSSLAQASAVDERILHAELDRQARTAVAATEKGFTGSGPVIPSELVERRPHLDELGLMTPYLTLNTDALEQNLAAMAAYCEQHHVALAPHAKTTMSPQVWAAHLRAGAWGLTAATPHQVAVLVSFGVRRIFYANEVADATTASFLAGLLDDDPALELCCYVDSPAGVTALDGALRDGRRGGRAGCPCSSSSAIRAGAAVPVTSRLRSRWHVPHRRAGSCA